MGGEVETFDENEVKEVSDVYNTSDFIVDSGKVAAYEAESAKTTNQGQKAEYDNLKNEQNVNIINMFVKVTNIFDGGLSAEEAKTATDSNYAGSFGLERVDLVGPDGKVTEKSPSNFDAIIKKFTDGISKVWDAMVKCLNTIYAKLSKFLKNIGMNSTEKTEALVTEIKSISEKMNTGTDEEKAAARTNLEEIIPQIESELENAKKDGDKSKTSKWKLKDYLQLLILLGLGGSWLALYLLGRGKDGCYFYTKEGKTKNEDCSGYYDDNQSLCRCPSNAYKVYASNPLSVTPAQMKTICDSAGTQDVFDFPMCNYSGFDTSSTSKMQCSGLQPGPLPCDETQTYYYGYYTYSPWDSLKDLLDFLPNTLDSTLDSILAWLKKIGLSILVLLGIVGLIILTMKIIKAAMAGGKKKDTQTYKLVKV